MSIYCIDFGDADEYKVMKFLKIYWNVSMRRMEKKDFTPYESFNTPHFFNNFLGQWAIDLWNSLSHDEQVQLFFNAYDWEKKDFTQISTLKKKINGNNTGNALYDDMKAFELYVLLATRGNRIDNSSIQKIDETTLGELLETLNNDKRTTPLIRVIKQRFEKYIGNIWDSVNKQTKQWAIQIWTKRAESDPTLDGEFANLFTSQMKQALGFTNSRDPHENTRQYHEFLRQVTSHTKRLHAILHWCNNSGDFIKRLKTIVGNDTLRDKLILLAHFLQTRITFSQNTTYGTMKELLDDPKLKQMIVKDWVILGPTKTFARAMQKILDYGRDPEKLMDLSRATLLFDNLYDLKKWVLDFISLCEQSDLIEKIALIDDIWQFFEAPKKWSWFRAFKMYVYTKEWWVFELQCNVKESYNAKTKWISWVLWVISNLSFNSAEIKKILEVITILNTKDNDPTEEQKEKAWEQRRRPKTSSDSLSWDFVFHIIRYFNAEEKLRKESDKRNPYPHILIIKKLQLLEKHIHESAWVTVMNKYKDVLKTKLPN